jgi:type II secretory pathway pseudopilin PulG
MQEIDVLICWVRAKLAQRNEHGFTAVEWLLVALGVIGIAGIAVAAVQSYVTSQTNKLGSP